MTQPDPATSHLVAADVPRSHGPSARLTIIRPSTGWVPLRLRELWEYRELLYFLTWRDIKVRYKQTALGAAWAVIQPLFTMVVFSVFFGRLAKLPVGRAALPALRLRGAAALAASSPTALTQAANSLVDHAEPDHQGLLPAPAHPARRGAGRAGRLR